jgi:DNA-binding NarL/FixJ family response regulator
MAQGAKLSFLHIEDHSLVRESLGRLLSGPPLHAEILAAGDMSEAMTLLADPAFSPDLVLLDLCLPDAKGCEGVAQLLRAYPRARLFVLSGDDQPRMAVEALKLGAKGYSTKADRLDILIAAIQLVLSGGVYVPKHTLGQTADAMGAGPEPQASQMPRAPDLTLRQSQVLRLLAEGLSNKEIARRLSLSPATVKSHMAIIMAVLGAANRTEVALRAAELLAPDSPTKPHN